MQALNASWVPEKQGIERPSLVFANPLAGYTGCGKGSVILPAGDWYLSKGGIPRLSLFPLPGLQIPEDKVGVPLPVWEDNKAD